MYCHHYEHYNHLTVITKKDYDHKDLAPLVPNAVDHKAGEDGERLEHLPLSCFSCCCCNNNEASKDIDDVSL